MSVENEYLTYDDVLLEPGYSEVNLSEVKLDAMFSRNISLNIPLCSSAMDTVTEAETAIVMAQEGGIGVIHKNLSAKMQGKQVVKVKKHEAGVIDEPFTVGPYDTMEKVYAIKEKFKISGFPVVDDNKKLVGMLTNRDIRFLRDKSLLVKDYMTQDNLVVVQQDCNLKKAKETLQKHRIEKLPVLTKDGTLAGLITVRDIEKSIEHPLANKDAHGRLRVAAAVGVGALEMERAELLVEKHVDALVLDTAHGHTLAVLKMAKELRKKFPHVDIVAGNVATKDGCDALIAAGVDAVKVGMGPGSICTTRVIAGIGVPQVSALFQAKEACLKKEYHLLLMGGLNILAT